MVGSTNVLPKLCLSMRRVQRKKTRVDEIVSAIKTKQEQQDLAVLFVDESHVSNEPYVQRGNKHLEAMLELLSPSCINCIRVFRISCWCLFWIIAVSIGVRK